MPSFAAIIVIGEVIQQVIIMVAMMVISRILTKKPDQQRTVGQNDQPRTITVRQPTAPWQIVFGEIRVAGVLTYAHESVPDLPWTLATVEEWHNFHMVITLSGNVLSGIGEVYFDEEVVPYDGNFNVVGHYANFAEIQIALGDETEQPFPLLVLSADSGWGATYLQQGRGKVYVRLGNSADMYPGGIPNITVVAKGAAVYDPRTSPAETHWASNPALLIAHYLCHPQYGLGADYATEINEAALITAANICDERVLINSSLQYTAQSIAEYAGNYIGLPTGARVPRTGDGVRFMGFGLPGGLSEGVTYYTIRTSTKAPETTYVWQHTLGAWQYVILPPGVTLAAGAMVSFGVTGSPLGVLPNWITAGQTYYVVEGVTLYEEDGETVRGWGFVIADSYANAINKVPIWPTVDPYSSGAIGTDDLTVLIYNTYSTAGWIQLAATYQDALAQNEMTIRGDPPVAATGTLTMIYYDEPRYTANGFFRADENPKDILQYLLASMAGRLVQVGGVWFIYAGAYQAPTLTLSEDDLAGEITVHPLLNRRDACNSVKGIFTDPSNSWQPVDFPPVESATYIAEDGDEQIWRDIDVSRYVTSPATAQRLAKIELLKSRQGLTVEAMFKMTAYRALTGCTVALTNTKFGWTAKEFEVSASSFGVNQDGGLSVALTLRETASGIYDWDASEENQVDIAPNTNLPDPWTVAAVGAPVITESLYETRSGRGVGVKATITWEVADCAFIHDYQVEMRLVGNTDWIIVGNTASTTMDVWDVIAGTYDFRVKARNNVGVFGPYGITRNEIIGFGALPAAPTGMALQTIGGMAVITLDQHAELDVLRGGRILVRHSEDSTDAVWETGLSIGNSEGFPGDSETIIVPLKAGTYMLKAQDSTGQRSTGFASMVTKQVSALNYSTLASIAESGSPLFPGTHSGTTVEGSALILTHGSPDTPVTASGTYSFQNGFNFGSITRVRVTGKIEAVVANASSFFDSDELFDSPDMFDEDADGSLCDAWLETRYTDDDPNPASSPSAIWGDWTRLDAAEFNTRAMQFRLQMRSYDPDFNLFIATLQVTAATA